MLRLLVEHGADLEASFDGSGRTPYGLAVRSGRRDLAEVLVSLGAQRRVEPLDELVGACLAGDRVAAERLVDRHPDAARLLRTSEADVVARAASRGQREAVEILLDLGVPVDARGAAGETALQATGDADLAALLVARGADPRKRSPDDQRHAAEPPSARPRMGASGGGRRADEPPYAELEWAAEAAYLRVLATSPRAATRPCGDGFAVVTGIEDNTENGVVCDSADDAVIAATLAWLADRRVPARWLLRDPVEPADLRDRLATAGASPERTAVVMGAQLDRLTADTPPPPALAIIPVREAATLAAWRDVARACLFDDADERARLHASLGLGEDAPVQHRVAIRDGCAIGAASFFLHGDTVLGQHLGVLAPERRSGVGRALVASIAREARDAGARTIVLGPTPDAIAFFALLGGVLRSALRDRAFYLPVPDA
jgi:GNAT superfamily N-acetyltransferase